MSLSDLIGNMDLAAYPKAAMVIFIGVFLLILYRVIFKMKKEEARDAAMIPMMDSVVTPNTQSASKETVA